MFFFSKTLERRIINLVSKKMPRVNQFDNFSLNSIKSWLGTGSQEQVLTAVKTADSYDSMFQIKEGHGLEPCQTGQSIKCGDNIRLEHINTGKNLHSAYGHKSALSRRQEVCGYGVDGDGDTGDNWILTCSDKSAGEQFYGGD